MRQSGPPHQPIFTMVGGISKARAQEQEMIGIWLQTFVLIALGYVVTTVVFLTRAN